MTDDLNDIDEAGVLCAEHHIPMYWDGEAQVYRCWELHRSGCGVTYDPLSLCCKVAA